MPATRTAGRVTCMASAHGEYACARLPLGAPSPFWLRLREATPGTIPHAAHGKSIHAPTDTPVPLPRHAPPGGRSSRGALSQGFHRVLASSSPFWSSYCPPFLVRRSSSSNPVDSPPACNMEAEIGRPSLIKKNKRDNKAACLTTLRNTVNGGWRTHPSLCTACGVNATERESAERTQRVARPTSTRICIRQPE